MFIYRFALVLLSPVAFLFFAIRLLRGTETRQGLAERLGGGERPQHTGPLIWLHGASIGELTAAKSLMTALLERDAAASLLVTMNSYTARKMVRGWQQDRLFAVMAPLDFRWTVGAFLRKWRPALMISLENELWPNRMAQCSAAGIPVIVAGGRISERAASLWSRFPRLGQTVLGSISHLAPQDAASCARFLELGVQADCVGPILNLKSSVALPDPDTEDRLFWARSFPYGKTFLAASTHQGEDELVLDALEKLRDSDPEIRLVIAPRHPERADAIAQLVTGRGYKLVRRSQGGDTPDNPDVLLADTLGEMPLWYSLAFATFVGGTWVDKGGHTPFEPVQFSSAVLHGGSVENHKLAFDALDAAGGARLVDDPTALAAALGDISLDKHRLAMLRSAEIAVSDLQAQSNAIAGLLDKIDSLN